jgi:lysylphosphatidylglycerol synthetase-like protein (DUF2156 family)
MQVVRRLLAVALFVAVLLLGWNFAAEHSSTVTIQLPFTQGLEVTLWAALLVAFGLGVGSTGVVAMLRATRQGLVARRYRKMIRDLEAEIHQLRNLPLANGESAPAEPAVAEGTSPAPKRALGRGA